MEDYSVTLASLEHRISDPQKSNWLMQTVDFKNWEPNEMSQIALQISIPWLCYPNSLILYIRDIC
jgi:hypothetical protein